jgi:hypothetical protein
LFQNFLFLSGWGYKVLNINLSLRSEDEGDDETIECEGFSEDEDQNHTYEDFILLSIRTYTSISYNSDSQAGCLGKT